MAASRTAKPIRLLHRVLVAVLVLAALGTVALWVDSYRLRPPPPPIPTEILEEVTVLYVPRKKQIENRTGLHWDCYADLGSSHVNRINYFIRTLRGELGLQRHVGIVTGSSLRLVQWDFAGVHYKNWVSPYSQWKGGRQEYKVQELRIPFWIVTASIAAYPFIALVLAVRRSIVLRRGRDSGHCLSCMYDLTGNVSGVCPECGVAIQSHVTPSPSAWHLNK